MSGFSGAIFNVFNKIDEDKGEGLIVIKNND